MSIQAGRDCVSIQIDEDLRNLSDVSFKPSIFRVYDRLRKENEDAYEPEMISIGPYHHGKPKLIPMEKHKLRLLKQLLNRRCEVNADRYVRAMRALEKKARKHYADPIDHELDSDKFVKMMLLDSCFIIELLRKIEKNDQENEPIFQMNHVDDGIFLDMKLLENQLPFFVLVEFMNMSGLNNEEASGGGRQEDIIDMAFKSFCRDGYQYHQPDVSLENIKHLLDLVLLCWHSSFAQILSGKSRAGLNSNWLNYIKPATELQEAGVEFKCAEESESPNGMRMSNVRFQNGVMKLPHLHIDPYTKVIALLRTSSIYLLTVKNITDYYILLDCRINSSRDVEILRHHGIIHHVFGDDDMVSAMIKKNVEYASTSASFSYAEVLHDVNEHRRQRRNVWIANLKHTYFNTPWAWISFLAAVMLLLLTLTQTIFGVLSYAAPQSQAHSGG